MTPPEAPFSHEEQYWTLHAAGHNRGFCLIAFPVCSFFVALFIGLWGSLPQLRKPYAPLWIIGVGIFAMLSVWAVLSLRSASRGLAKAGMSPRKIQRADWAVWRSAAVLMMIEGGLVLGHLAVTRGRTPVYGPIEDHRPLVAALVLYVAAGALLLGRSWKGLQDAGSAPEFQEITETTEQARGIELYEANRLAGVIIIFPIAMLFFAILIASGHGVAGAQTVRLVIIPLCALGAGLGVWIVRRSRRHFEAAGYSQEEARDQIAAVWRAGAVAMILIGVSALGLVYLAFDVLTPADRPWTLGTALTYTAIGVILFWWNRRRMK